MKYCYFIENIEFTLHLILQLKEQFFYVPAFLFYGYYLAEIGQYDKAIEVAKKGLEVHNQRVSGKLHLLDPTILPKVKEAYNDEYTAYLINNILMVGTFVAGEVGPTYDKLKKLHDETLRSNQHSSYITLLNICSIYFAHIWKNNPYDEAEHSYIASVLCKMREFGTTQCYIFLAAYDLFCKNHSELPGSNLERAIQRGSGEAIFILQQQKAIAFTFKESAMKFEYHVDLIKEILSDFKSTADQYKEKALQFAKLFTDEEERIEYFGPVKLTARFKPSNSGRYSQSQVLASGFSGKIDLYSALLKVKEIESSNEYNKSLKAKTIQEITLKIDAVKSSINIKTPTIENFIHLLTLYYEHQFPEELQSKQVKVLENYHSALINYTPKDLEAIYTLYNKNHSEERPFVPFSVAERRYIEPYLTQPFNDNSAVDLITVIDVVIAYEFLPPNLFKWVEDEFLRVVMGRSTASENDQCSIRTLYALRQVQSKDIDIYHCGFGVLKKLSTECPLALFLLTHEQFFNLPSVEKQAWLSQLPVEYTASLQLSSDPLSRLAWARLRRQQDDKVGFETTLTGLLDLNYYPAMNELAQYYASQDEVEIRHKAYKLWGSVRETKSKFHRAKAYYLHAKFLDEAFYPDSRILEFYYQAHCDGYIYASIELSRLLVSQQCRVKYPFFFEWTYHVVADNGHPWVGYEFTKVQFFLHHVGQRFDSLLEYAASVNVLPAIKRFAEALLLSCKLDDESIRIKVKKLLDDAKQFEDPEIYCLQARFYCLLEQVDKQIISLEKAIQLESYLARDELASLLLQHFNQQKHAPWKLFYAQDLVKGLHPDTSRKIQEAITTLHESIDTFSSQCDATNFHSLLSIYYNHQLTKTIHQEVRIALEKHRDSHEANVRGAVVFTLWKKHYDSENELRNFDLYQEWERLLFEVFPSEVVERLTNLFEQNKIQHNIYCRVNGEIVRVGAWLQKTLRDIRAFFELSKNECLETVKDKMNHVQRIVNISNERQSSKRYRPTIEEETLRFIKMIIDGVLAIKFNVLKVIGLDEISRERMCIPPEKMPAVEVFLPEDKGAYTGLQSITNFFKVDSRRPAASASRLDPLDYASAADSSSHLPARSFGNAPME